MTPESCLLCSGLINSAKLQEESISEDDRKRQRYVDEPEVVAPAAYMHAQPRHRRIWL